MSRSAAITYEGLPISSGGAHTLRTRGFVETARSLSDFVSSVSIISTPTDLTLELLSGGEINETEFARQYEDAYGKYGLKKFTRAMGDYIGHQWALDVNTLHEVAAQLEKLRPIFHAGYAGWQVVLHATWKLEFREEDSHLALPYQSRTYYNDFEITWNVFLGESGVYARISEKSTAALFLSLPFEEVTEDCHRLAVRIQKAFPVRLSAKHWKRWSLTKAGKNYVGRKIKSPILD